MPNRRRNSDSGNENDNEEVNYIEETGDATDHNSDHNSNLSEPLDKISVNADPPATQVNDTFDPVQTL